MPEVTDPYVPGQPCWVDLMADDQQAALDFYRDLFGWQGELGPPEFGGYSVCTLNGRAVAGIGPTMAPEGMPKPPVAWTTHLSTDDADAAQRAVTEAGGTVLVPVMDVGTTGRMQIVADPTGAVFGIWQAGDFAGAAVSGEHGALVWNDLHTNDIPAASAFYRAVFDAEIAPMEGAEGYNSFNLGGRSLGGVADLANEPPGTPPHWLTYFAVDDPDRTVDQLVKKGGKALIPPFDMVAGRMAVVADPQGAVFAVIAPLPM
ncbi:VOC family protein [Kitasatospora sp. NPDC057015]|uniref:VOC family protein n=1 Tax=Kitasatospora sp. NPDC057015 TaxID=3346001 RepID=UPI00363E3212